MAGGRCPHCNGNPAGEPKKDKGEIIISVALVIAAVVFGMALGKHVAPKEYCPDCTSTVCVEKKGGKYQNVYRVIHDNEVQNVD